jgi:hypothetical protein
VRLEYKSCGRLSMDCHSEHDPDFAQQYAVLHRLLLGHHVAPSLPPPTLFCIIAHLFPLRPHSFLRSVTEIPIVKARSLPGFVGALADPGGAGLRTPLAPGADRQLFARLRAVGAPADPAGAGGARQLSRLGRRARAASVSGSSRGIARLATPGSSPVSRSTSHICPVRAAEPAAHVGRCQGPLWVVSLAKATGSAGGDRLGAESR